MIRIGLLGASRISRGAIIRPATAIDDVEVAAVAARDPERAGEFAEEHGIDHVEPDYDALINSDHVDLIYNGLPPVGHAAWSIAALEAGKHVLCEKPFAMNAGEAHAMVEAAERTGRVLIEAFHYRFHPAFIQTLEIIRSGEIGAVQSIQAHFNVTVAYSPGEIRYDASLGGGAMMDLGCYPLHWVRAVMGTEPRVLSAHAQRHETGVDIAMQAVLEFPGGVGANISSSMSEELPEGVDAELKVIGESGVLTFVNPLVPHIGHELIVENETGKSTEEVAGESTYHHQLEHVVAVLRGETEQVTGDADAVGNMAMLDEIYSRAGFQARF